MPDTSWRWTAEEETILRERWATTRASTLAVYLPGRTAKAIAVRATHLKLVKTATAERRARAAEPDSQPAPTAMTTRPPTVPAPAQPPVLANPVVTIRHDAAVPSAGGDDARLRVGTDPSIAGLADATQRVTARMATLEAERDAAVADADRVRGRVADLLTAAQALWSEMAPGPSSPLVSSPNGHAEPPPPDDAGDEDELAALRHRVMELGLMLAVARQMVGPRAAARHLQLESEAAMLRLIDRTAAEVAGAFTRHGRPGGRP
jgi:hypothetical protein